MVAWAVGQCLLWAGTSGCSLVRMSSRPFMSTALTMSTSYIAIFSGISAFTLVTYCMCTVAYIFASARISRVVHSRLLQSVMGSTFRFTSLYRSRRTADRQKVAGRDSFIACHLQDDSRYSIRCVCYCSPCDERRQAASY
jgi:hypothetical protein